MTLDDELKVEKVLKKEIIKKIKELQNPYPPDIFSHTNTEKMDITKGRFHEHCFNQVEWTKRKIIEIIEDEL